LKFYVLIPTEEKFLNWENASLVITSVELKEKKGTCISYAFLYKYEL